MCRVTLYIPCFNAGKYLNQVLPSVLSQTYPIEEILVVDDDATDDDTVRIVQEWIDGSTIPIRHVSAGLMTGLAHARNVGIAEAGTEFVASLDADCVPEPDWLEKLMGNFTEDAVAGVGGRLIESIILNNADRWRTAHNPQHWGDLRITNPEFVFGHSNVFRKTAVLDAGGYDERWRTASEDYHLSVSLLNGEWKLVYDPGAVVRHLKTDNLKSLLNTNFNYGKWGIEKGLKNTIRRIKWHFQKGKSFLKSDLNYRRWNLLPISLIYPFRMIYLELETRLNKRHP